MTSSSEGPRLQAPPEADEQHAPTYRIGIDVGGTFTKGVRIDGRSQTLVASSTVPTTHDHERGVAAGVVNVFRKLLDDTGVPPHRVVFIVHSTTQATNALLE